MRTDRNDLFADDAIRRERCKSSTGCANQLDVVFNSRIENQQLDAIVFTVEQLLNLDLAHKNQSIDWFSEIHVAWRGGATTDTFHRFTSPEPGNSQSKLVSGQGLQKWELSPPTQWAGSLVVVLVVVVPLSAEVIRVGKKKHSFDDEDGDGEETSAAVTKVHY